MTLILFIHLFYCAYAQDTQHKQFLLWTHNHPPVPTKAPPYRALSQMYSSIAHEVRKKPGVITPMLIGHTVKKHPIWAFSIRDPAREVRASMLVFAGLHPLEWVSNEVATELILDLVDHPISYVEIIIIPCVNVDRRLLAEKELNQDIKKYRRSNSKGVDLNRDFAHHRHSDAVWKYLIPSYYTTSHAPLSQPETKALDKLAQQKSFHSVVSLHSFGGYIFYPWAGTYKNHPKAKEHHLLALRMVHAQRDAHPYKAMQLSHWGFPFRALGSEIDHFSAQYGSYTFLIELTRSGLWPPSPKNFSHPFRWYNPKNPIKDMRRGVDSVLGLARQISIEHWNLDISR